jgi:hypothetical protein
MSLSSHCECGNALVQVDVEVSVRETFSSSLLDMAVPDQGTIHLVQPARKAGFFSSKSNKSEIFALTCSGCGKVTFYASELENVLPDR